MANPENPESALRAIQAMGIDRPVIPPEIRQHELGRIATVLLGLPDPGETVILATPFGVREAIVHDYTDGTHVSVGIDNTGLPRETELYASDFVDMVWPHPSYKEAASVVGQLPVEDVFGEDTGALTDEVA